MFCYLLLLLLLFQLPGDDRADEFLKRVVSFPIFLSQNCKKDPQASERPEGTFGRMER